MIELLRGNTLLLLFLVTAIGYTIGRIPLFNIRLGSAAVLFVGLFFGALDPALSVPLLLPQLGLVIFLYALGLANGASFFHALRNGNGQIGFILFFLTLPVLIIGSAFFLFDVDAGTVAGLYAGSVTNTAGLAGVLDLIDSSLQGDAATRAVAATVVGYSFAYPIGVIGRILILALMQRVWRIDFAAEAYALRDQYPTDQELINCAIEVTNSEMTYISLRELRQREGFDVIFGRIVRDKQISLVSGETQFELGDIVVIAGEEENARHVIDTLGRDAGAAILNDYSIYTKRRLFVSNPNAVGQPIAALDLKEQYGALITRVRRGDTDVLARNETILELGDRVRVLARRDDMPALVELFGDSYADASKVNLLSVGFGVTFGLLLGTVAVTLPGGIGFRLGFAGGTLIIALILGALRRTGDLVWTLPYSVNQTLQQTGLLLLLAGIGVRSGNSLQATLALPQILLLLTVATVAVSLSTMIALIVGYKVRRIPFAILAGMVASQPAVLSYATDRAQNQLPNIGFSLASPIGIIIKVAFAQLLFGILTAL